jgi:UDP-GlcNAc:undecaprenyl-phosphate/decaprenyl-phosphate GlcNAc-1-phosphate transferase
LASYLLVFAVSAAVTFLTTPLVRQIALRIGWIDRPSDRKVHPTPTPTVGGLAIHLGVLAGLVAARFLPFLRTLYDTTSDLDAAAIAGTVIVMLGVVDDTRGVSAIGKLAGQVLVAGIVVLLGVQLVYFYFPGQGVLSNPPDVAVPLTILWILVVVNAVNLIDGLDGLAAGMVAIAAAAFFIYMAWPAPGAEVEATTTAVLSAIAAGAAIGFLPWNFHPAKIFMGDSGALLLGLVMAVASIAGAARNLEEPTGGEFAVIVIPVTLPLLVLAVALLDVGLAIVRRMRRGVGIGHADKEHIHHRLLDIGHSHRQAVLLMYLWAVLISGCALAVAFIDGGTLETVVVGGAVAVLVATVLPRLIRDRSPRGSDRLSVLGNGAGPTPSPADGSTPSDGAPPSDSDGAPPAPARAKDSS